MAASFSFLSELPVVFSALVLLLLLAMASFYAFKSTSRPSSSSSVIPTKWPIVGELPAIAANLHNLHGHLAVILAASGHNLMAGGLGLRFFITCDPENVRHIFTTNHGNYPKGEEFAEIFDVMSGSFFTVDGEACQRQRAKIKSVLSNPRLLARMAACCRDKVENGLLSSLASTAGAAFDMQELITRFVFDLTAMPVFGVDPGLLPHAGMPRSSVSVADAMDTVMEVALFRHTVPPSCWKVMRRLKIGPERKLAAAHAVLAGFITEMMEKRKKSISSSLAGSSNDGGGDGEQVPVDIMSSYVDDPDYKDDQQLLRATLVNYMIAGRDTIGTTLPWLFYNLAINPHVVSSIRAELSPIAAAARRSATMTMFTPEETKPLVYLQAALYESLRLHPPGPIERKTVAAADVMPSGHAVRVGDTILVSLHAMGRMEGVWGEDCGEYKPERWLISGEGAGGGGGASRLRYVPTHKFLAFNSGPRMCLGKEIALMQMKTAVAAVVWNFDVEVVKGQIVEPKPSCILQMKHGLMVRAKKRQIMY